MTRSRLVTSAALAGAFLLANYALAILVGPAALYAVAREDGLVEWLGALFFLAASALFFVAWARSTSGNRILRWKTRRNIFYLFLAGLFFFAFGEEIAWGSRLLGLAPPAWFAQHNIQGDLTLHNLDFFTGGPDRLKETLFQKVINVNFLFQVFLGAFFLLVPLAGWLSPTARRWLDRLGWPLTPIGLGLLFPVNYLASKVAESIVALTVRTRITEVKETLFGFVIFVVALQQVQSLLAQRRARRINPPAAPILVSSNGRRAASPALEKKDDRSR